ncbi:hypothetical protein BN1050_02634 [Metalysinibacillus saudimassiliensis]|uniref:Uncharacterized protein n=1 Tax=Metalysinibacillus saudimassiliensis TaxID=1461583 RepID=A0A078MEJ5_9BACL|nr:hypothetical protein BN1050_02634 [Metalysinibacillus saudimassiliensis]
MIEKTKHILKEMKENWKGNVEVEKQGEWLALKTDSHSDVEYLLADIISAAEYYEKHTPGECITKKSLKGLSYLATSSKVLGEGTVFTDVTDIKIKEGKILIWGNDILIAVLHADDWELTLIEEDDRHEQKEK